MFFSALILSPLFQCLSYILIEIVLQLIKRFPQFSSHWKPSYNVLNGWNVSPNGTDYLWALQIDLTEAGHLQWKFQDPES